MDDLSTPFIDNNGGNVHLAGICGIGMAGLAWLLHDLGYTVSGCDVRVNYLAEVLRSAGIDVSSGHSARHLALQPEWLVRSSAVSEKNSEIVAAAAAGIPVFRRGEVLAGLLKQCSSIAVAGTHGKTTTTAFIVQMMRNAADGCGWYLGGELDRLPRNAAYQAGKWLVAEADESDGTLRLYHPSMAVITNVEFDHMEHFSGCDEFEAVFRSFIGSVGECIIWCGDDKRLRRLIDAASCRCVCYGLHPGADIYAEAIEPQDSGCSFALFEHGRFVKRVYLPVPGLHNVRNALAAYTAVRQTGAGVDDCCAAISRLMLPLRRFQPVTAAAGVSVITDYAHHPTEVRALIEMIRRPPECRVRAVFQPHRYTRTRALGPDFPEAFSGVEEVLLCPVYAASEERSAGDSVWKLYEHFRRQSNPSTLVIVADGLKSVEKYLSASVKRGDFVLLIGAGDINGLADSAVEWGCRSCVLPQGLLSDMSKIKYNADISTFTSWQTGGRADVLVHAGTEEDIKALFKYSNAHGVVLHFLGRGSNIWVSDLGIRGIVVRLDGADFNRLTVAGNEITAGAAIGGGKLLAAAENAGLGGLEFLEGIPGSMGGMLRMNAGAGGEELCRQIKWLRWISADGRVQHTGGDELLYSYRECRTLCEGVALSVCFGLEAKSGDAIRQARALLRSKRAWLSVLRCAGSVFKNPPGEYAGRLIESAGFKGYRVGGAWISERHANVIVTESGATASDVRCLIELVREGVYSACGIILEPEVILWDG